MCITETFKHVNEKIVILTSRINKYNCLDYKWCFHHFNHNINKKSDNIPALFPRGSGVDKNVETGCS